MPVTVRNDTAKPETIQVGPTAQGAVKIKKRVFLHPTRGDFIAVAGCWIDSALT